MKFKEDIYPTAVYTRSVSLLAYPTVGLSYNQLGQNIIFE